ncbi:MAG: type II toxin-antitoxin system VapC family toxin [Candidatus Hydrogenedentes bacterium]|nr:type II toxin-antitoxin system VapC family toxin [Candidatus Hydrogenedentota bacterium]
MILPDANVLIYAFRRDVERHSEYRQWLESVLTSEPTLGLSDIVLSSVVRIVTHPRVFAKPSSLQQALAFTNFLWSHPKVVRVTPGNRHWGIFENLCRQVDARGNLISDAYLAAVAIEAGADWITTDRDFSRFPGLRWRHPLRRSS